MSNKSLRTETKIIASVGGEADDCQQVFDDLVELEAYIEEARLNSPENSPNEIAWDIKRAVITTVEEYEIVENKSFSFKKKRG